MSMSGVTAPVTPLGTSGLGEFFLIIIPAVMVGIMLDRTLVRYDYYITSAINLLEILWGFS
jgi:hypothetical protein